MKGAIYFVYVVLWFMFDCTDIVVEIAYCSLRCSYNLLPRYGTGHSHNQSRAVILSSEQIYVRALIDYDYPILIHTSQVCLGISGLVSIQGELIIPWPVCECSVIVAHS